jgi:hypothetical protein
MPKLKGAINVTRNKANYDWYQVHATTKDGYESPPSKQSVTVNNSHPVSVRPTTAMGRKEV